MDVEVGEDGYVPPGLLARWLRRRGSPCNDYDQKADVVLPVRITPRQAAAWMADPDAYDIEGVDVRGNSLRNVGDRKGESRRIHDHIIVYGLPGEEARICREFDEAFPSLEEQRKMIAKGDLVLEARPLKDDVSGTHSGDLIQLDRDYGIRNGVVVHEGVHHLRAVDGDRKGAATVLSPDSIPYTGKSTNPSVISKAKRREVVCVEESCTVAEQMARQRDFDPSGYYAHVQVYDPKTHRYRSPTAAEARRMAEEDRKLFTNGTGKPPIREGRDQVGERELGQVPHLASQAGEPHGNLDHAERHRHEAEGRQTEDGQAEEAEGLRAQAAVLQGQAEGDDEAGHTLQQIREEEEAPMAVRMAGRFGLLLDREELEARGRSVPSYTRRYRKEAYGAGAIARDYRWKCWRGRFASIRV